MIHGDSGGETSTKSQRIASAASRVQADIAFALLDVFVIVAAYTLGLAIRMLDPQLQDGSDLWADLAIAIPIIVAVHLTANIAAGAYGHVWEHASTSEAVRVVAANAFASVALVGSILVLRAIDPEVIVIPLSVLAIGGMASLLGMGMVRFRSRLFSFHRLSGASSVLVVGTDRDAVAFARQAPFLGSARRVVGFLSQDEEGDNGHRRLAGLQVLGAAVDIAEVVEAYDVDEVVVVGANTQKVREIVDLCLDVDVRLRMLPSAEDVLRDGVSAVDVRDIQVEDLLVRQPVETELDIVREILEGKRVLITGAGGSIGSEVVRQVMRFEPAEICALDRDETLLHDAALRWTRPAHTALGDVRDPDRMLRIFEQFQPHVVFHAAALKHVPVLEANPEEAVLTNVIGTRNVIEAGSRNGMERFVLISTDKAVAPSSVMGATKRAAELMTEVGSARRDGCVYTAVRFGNVLGSRGSVIPTFVEQIKSGGPVTVTDPAMTRYFMTVDEAVQLVLQAAALAKGSELFLLDMGEPIRIESLARRLIRLAGMSPGRDIEISFTGRRPGEKLSEMLALEPMEHTVHEKIFEVHSAPLEPQLLMERVNDLEKFAVSGDAVSVVELLSDLTRAKLTAGSVRATTESTSPPAVRWS